MRRKTIEEIWADPRLQRRIILLTDYGAMRCQHWKTLISGAIGLFLLATAYGFLFG